MDQQPLKPAVRIGEYTYGTPAILRWSASDTCVIGRYCSIAKQVTIMAGGEHRTDWITTFPIREIFKLEGAGRSGHPSSKGPTIIGNDVWIGYGATILSGVTVGDGAVIGAQAVVTKDVEPYSIVAGNPACLVRYRFSPEQIKILLEIKWWEWPAEVVIEYVDVLSSGDIDLLVDIARQHKSDEAAGEPRYMHTVADDGKIPVSKRGLLENSNFDRFRRLLKNFFLKKQD